MVNYKRDNQCFHNGSLNWFATYFSIRPLISLNDISDKMSTQPDPISIYGIFVQWVNKKKSYKKLPIYQS